MKNKLIQLSIWIAAHITLVVVLVTAVALFLPSSFVWIDTSAITPMLGVVMFGMGLTLRPSDFRPVLQHPKDILVGELAQFLIMPSLAWLLCKLLSLPEELALGVILVGCCPGGTASNVICYLAKGDVALSVAMTGVSTLLAPIIDTCPRMVACRRIGESRRSRHVLKYRASGDSTHRTGSGCQSLLPADYPTDSAGATDDFYLIHCLYYRHYRSTQRDQHPYMQPDSGCSGYSAQRARTSLRIRPLCHNRKRTV